MTILPDVLAPRLGIVFCGTQAGRASAMRRAYYAGPGNKFWPVLHGAGFVPRRFRPEEFLQLLDHGLGLTDVAKATFGPDTALKSAHVDIEGFLMKMRAMAPAFIAFNGKRAASAVLGLGSEAIAYGRQPVDLAGCTTHVLPSTSGAASGFWSIEPWQELAAAWRAQAVSA